MASGARARHRDVARRLGHRVGGAEVRVERAESALAVGRERHPLHRPGHPDHGRVAARPRHRLPLHARVVLLEDPALARRRSATTARRGTPRADPSRTGRRSGSSASVALARRRRRPVVLGSVVGEGARRHLRDDLAAVRDATAPRPPPAWRSTAVCSPHRSHTASHRRQLRGMHDREHPLLRLRREDLERLHAGLAQRHRVQIQVRAHARAGRRLADRARDAGAAQILQALQQPLRRSARSDASINSFSANGSPICTEGRDAAEPSSSVAEASTLTPPMPSRPVVAP